MYTLSFKIFRKPVMKYIYILVSTSNFQIKEHFLFAFAISTFIAGSMSIATKSLTECILIFLHRRVNLNV